MKKLSTLLFALLSLTLFAQQPELLKDLDLGNNIFQYHSFNGKVYFGGRTNTLGLELHVTDGTPAGTYLIKDIRNGRPGGNPAHLQGFNGQLYFVALFNQIWTTDDTEAGTVKVMDGDTVGFDFANYLTDFNGMLYFTANDTNTTADEGLWVSDGTAANTSLVKLINPSGAASINDITVFNGNMYFTAEGVDLTRRLWISDGTTAGTQLFKDVDPVFAGSQSVGEITVWDNAFYFLADINGSGVDLWKSDGTIAGTQLLKDFDPVGPDLRVSEFTVCNGKLYFTVINFNTLVSTVWESDGTEMGTKPVPMPGVFSVNGEFLPAQMTCFKDKLYFFTSLNLTDDTKLYVHDPANGSTTLIDDQLADTVSVAPNSLVGYNDTLYVILGTDSLGEQLYKTDGTSHLELLQPVNNSSVAIDACRQTPGPYFAEDLDMLLFTADYSGDGRELFFLQTEETQDTIVDTTAINNRALELGLSLYPNPVHDALTLELSNTQTPLNYQLSDLSGRLLLTGTTAGTSTTISLAQLAAGTYLLQLLDEGNTVAVQRVVKW